MRHYPGEATRTTDTDQVRKTDGYGAASESDQARPHGIAGSQGGLDYRAYLHGLGGPVRDGLQGRDARRVHVGQKADERAMGAYEYATGRKDPGGSTASAQPGPMSAHEYATGEAPASGQAPSAGAASRGIEVPNVVQEPHAARLDSDWAARDCIGQAADLATLWLDQVRADKLEPAAALASLNEHIAAAYQALQRVWLDHRAPLAGDDKGIHAWEMTEYQLDRLLAAVMQLEELARSSVAANATPPTSEVTQLATLAALLGYRPPSSLADAQSRVAVACPPGSENTDSAHCELDPATRQGRVAAIEPKLAVMLTVFFDACTTQERALEAMIEHDAKWAEVVTDVLVGALVATGAGAIAGGAMAAGAETAGAEAGMGKGAEILGDSLRDAVKGAAGELADAGQHAADGDVRNGTIDALEALKAVMTSAVTGFPYEKLGVLDDDALRLLADQIGCATDHMRESVAAFVAAYRQQVEPLDTPDYADPRMNGMFPATVETRAVWISAPGRQPRLAVVKAVVHATLGNAARSLAAWPGTAKLPVDEVDFVAWVDPRLVPVAAQQAHGTVTIGQVKNLPAEGHDVQP